MLTFTKNSGLVKTWVGLVMNGTYTIYDVPNLLNLKTVVAEVLQEAGVIENNTTT